MATNKRLLLDLYLKYPIRIDIFIVFILLIVWHLFHPITFSFVDKPTALNVMSSLIGTCISLAGFILAALTIIVTFRSNLKAKGVDTADNAMELIITSGYYNQIVKVYIDAISEFLIVAFGLYMYWLSIDAVKSTVADTKITFCGILMTGAPVVRSLWVLFSIIRLEKFDKQ